MSKFRAFIVQEEGTGFKQSVVERSIADLPAGEVLVKVQFSSVNYKDALIGRGHRGFTKSFPHTPGIDAAGAVVSSTDTRFSKDDEVIVHGYGLGSAIPGGYGQYIRVPADWIVPMPEGMTPRESMVIGTAGFTSALCIMKLEQMGASPKDGPVIVTGATGGVGSIVVSLLSKLGYDVVASSGKPEKTEYLKSLGAKSVIDRSILTVPSGKPMGAETWAHAVDVVGGQTLTNVLKGLKYGGSASICGLVGSPDFEANVRPFILRGINLLGIDSVQLPLSVKKATWHRLATDMKIFGLDSMTSEIGLDEVSSVLESVYLGNTSGRTLVRLF